MESIVTLQNPGLSEIFPLFFGWEKCRNGHSFGPAVRECFLIHYILDGKGSFTCGRTYRLQKGRCFLICPGDVTFYQADENDPWSYCWIAFGGESAETLLRRAGLGKDNPVFGNDRISEVFQTLLGRMQSGKISWENAGMSLLSALFALFASLPQPEEFHTQKEKYILNAKSYLSSLLAAPFTVERLARHCGLDRHYLCRIFREQTGLSPQQYMIRLRMRKARGLLENSSLSVGDVARSVGYTDAYHFSKIFKAKTGLSPQNYRQKTLAESRSGESPGAVQEQGR